MLIFSDKSSYVLSVRDSDKANGEPCVKHYRIRKMDDGGFFISAKRTFDSLLDLINHYKGETMSRNDTKRIYNSFLHHISVITRMKLCQKFKQRVT